MDIDRGSTVRAAEGDPSPIGPKRSSLFFRFIILVTIFLIVPLTLYARFQSADDEKNRLLVEAIEKQGDLVAAALEPSIRSEGRADILAVSSALKFLGESAGANVKLLLNPSTNSGGTFLVASWPNVDVDLIDSELNLLYETGVFRSLGKTCTVPKGGSIRYTNARGERELIAALNSIKTPDGCWIVLTSYNEGELFDSTLARSYWSNPEVQIAAVVYILLAAVTIWLFADIWINLRLFERTALDHLRGRVRSGTFQRRNRIRELDTIARTFDRMVFALQRSGEAIRLSAEENAHALKAPIAVLRQSLDSVRRSATGGKPAPSRSVEIMDASLDKLDDLVTAARELDLSAADSLEITPEKVPLRSMIEGIIEDYASITEARSIDVAIDAASGTSVTVDPDLLETSLENLIENALGFSPQDGKLGISIKDKSDQVEIVISDEGPGIPEDKLPQIFDRYISIRDTSNADPLDTTAHFGIGLFIVRRNIEILGGYVSLRNREDGGVDAIVSLPKY